jgi:hypothetical protein
MKASVQSIALAAAGLASVASAHMEMSFPAPFKSKFNPHAAGDVDSDMTAPIGGGNFPCKGYHSLFGTPAGAPTADFAPGQSYNMTIIGGAAHEGGSCQVSLSYDKGATFTAIHSYIGNCPIQGEGSFDFTIPSDTPAGEAIFAWTWFNKVGNREMYMNCAAVNIAGGATKRQASVPFSSRPAMFTANIGGTCKTAETTDVEFPAPGPDVTIDPAAAPGAPVGDCGAAEAPATPPAQSSAVEAPPAQSSVVEAPPAQSSVVEAPPVISNPVDPADPTFVTAPPAATTEMPAAPPAASSEVVPPAASSEVVPPAASSEVVPPAASSEVVPPVVETTVPATPETSLPVPPVQSPVESAAPPTETEDPEEGDECDMVSMTMPVPTPSTMMTVSKPMASATSTAVAPVTPVPTPDAPATGGEGGFAAGAACTSEGQWNCVGGSQFQRCASGQWSILQGMASGLTCVPGQAETLAYQKRAPRGLWWI